ncbi:MAG: methylmalonyl-CoA mutase family protein [Gammaproteobacteria bacterium]|nr:methylmalonyl-CoA mutase family protein [Gammaproteobacteria bacterium]MDH5311345.1 methylmalonyl-CoA mutase family protein [Gammaproteobacteria bacterium]
MSDLKNIRTASERWENTVLKKQLERAPELRDSFATPSGIPVKRLYTPLDLEGSEYASDLGFPGEFPYTRGVYPTMYRGRPWTMRMYAGYGTAEDTNKRFRYLLAEGMRGLSIAFDLPTQLGYDSDDPLSEGAVGRVGVAVDTLADMETVFDGIPLDEVSTSMTINAPATVLLAMYIVLAGKQGVPAAKLSGTTQNDILKEFVARGTYIFPPKPSMQLGMDIVEYCSRHLPKWNTMSITGYHIREAGADAVQELAFTIANAIAYIEAARTRGLDVDDFASRLSYSLGCHRDLFEEVAKFRAARRLFARVMKERFDAKKAESYLFRTFSGSCGSTLVAQQPLNNTVRIALHALMGALGGHQAIHTASWDEGHALPSEEASKLALRTQQILATETGLCSTIDPLAGSYYVESLTNEIEKRAADYLRKIDEQGGMLAAIENGYIGGEIQRSSLRQQQALESGETVVVGVNGYVEEDEQGYDEQYLHIDQAIDEKQARKLAEVRASRSPADVAAALENLAGAIDRGENLMPPTIDAVRCYASIGEICAVMRDKWGEYRDTSIR